MAFKLLPLVGIAVLKIAPALSREITFPPLAAVRANGQSFQKAFVNSGDDLTEEIGGAGTGLTTYANLPYLKCLSDSDAVEKYDIAVLGAPFDTVSQGLSRMCFKSFGASLFVLRFSTCQSTSSVLSPCAHDFHPSIN